MLTSFFKKPPKNSIQTAATIPKVENYDPRFDNQEEIKEVHEEENQQKIKKGYFPNTQFQSVDPFRSWGKTSSFHRLGPNNPPNNRAVLIKKKKGVSNKKLITSLLGIFGTKHIYGNDIYGQAWVEQQKKRQDFKILKEIQHAIKPEENTQNQVIYMEPSVSEERLQQLRKKGRPFLDDTFPPGKDSLFGQDGYNQQWSQVRWKKISKYCPDAKIFVGKIEPYDIKQGFLGDCYFLAGVAAIAERPDRIIQLFLLKQRNQSHYYSVKVLFRGKWRVIDLDQYVPAIYTSPVFGKSLAKELWVILLEKAWAKLYGSYQHIEAGFPEESLHDLTGAPIKHIFLKKSLKDPQQKEENWQYLLKASKMQFAMVVSSNPGSDTQKSNTGIVQGHAYTFLNADYINFGYQEKIVQLRNPWGAGQFKGRWSDFDSNWNYVSEGEKERLGWKKDRDDGLFYMTYDDFLAEFRTITIAEVDDHSSYIYKSQHDPKCQGVYFRVQIVAKGTYSFQLDKTPERIFTGSKQKQYQYPQAWFELTKIEDNGIERYSGIASKRRTLFRQHELEPGTYVAWAKIDFDPYFEEQFGFEVTLAIYGEYACSIFDSSKEQFQELRKGHNHYDKRVLEQAWNLPFLNEQNKWRDSYMASPQKKKQQQNKRGHYQKKEDHYHHNKGDYYNPYTKPRTSRTTPYQQSVSSKNLTPFSEKQIEKVEKVSHVDKDKKPKKMKKVIHQQNTVETFRKKANGDVEIKTTTKEKSVEEVIRNLKEGKVKKTKETVVDRKKIQHMHEQQCIDSQEIFQKKIQKTLEKPDGEIIKKIQKSEGRTELVSEDGDESSFASFESSFTSHRQGDISSIHHEEASRSRANISRDQSRNGNSMLESEESGQSEIWKEKEDKLILKMKELGKEKKNSAVYIESSDEDAEQVYDQK